MTAQQRHRPRRYRYNRKRVIDVLDRRASDSRSAARVVAVEQNCDNPLYRDVPRAWFERTIEIALSGTLPQLDAFPGLALTAATPRNDVRWAIYDKLYEWAPKLLDAGTVRVVPPLGQHATALQLTVNADRAELAINRAVRGQFWVLVDGEQKHMDIGVEVDDRLDSTHFTVLHGTLGGSAAALVMWNVNPSIVRTASSNDLKAFLSRSIFVRQTRERWHRLEPHVEPDDIRTAIYESELHGLHPAEAGTWMVDYLESAHHAGLPSRRSSVVIQKLTDDDAAIGVEPSERGGDALDAAERLNELRLRLDPSERLLFDVMKETPDAKPSDWARRLGCSLADVEAVLKRIRRKGKKI